MFRLPSATSVASSDHCSCPSSISSSLGSIHCSLWNNRLWKWYNNYECMISNYCFIICDSPAKRLAIKKASLKYILVSELQITKMDIIQEVSAS